LEARLGSVVRIANHVGTQADGARADHAKPGRIDVVLLRTGDSTGASGSGSLAFVLFDAIAPGPANLTITGSVTAPGGAPLPVQFGSPPSVTVK